MRCPDCGELTLRHQPARGNVLVDVCTRCQGLWLDRGKVYDLSAQPRVLEQQLRDGLRERHASDHTCPRCAGDLERGRLPDRDAEVEECRHCGGWWVPGDQVNQLAGSGPPRLELPVPGGQPTDELPAEADTALGEAVRERHRQMAAGLLALPNLMLRSLLLLGMLYGMVGLVLVSLVEFGGLDATLALVIGVVFAALQFLVGPFVMDWSLGWFYDFQWITAEELPEHLRSFVARVCQEQRMKFPSFGLIRDGAPTAFTYGHHPSNARVIISRGILELLEPPEAEAVVAHELGHAHNWDMALMTLASLVPLVLYYLYRIGMRLDGGKGKGKGYGPAIAAGAFILYIVSEYLVLWFSRTREYYADRFAGQVTGNPNALASALVKIAYGLAAQAPATAKEKDKNKDREEQSQVKPMGALRALNIFDPRAAVGLVMSSAVGEGSTAQHPDVEQIKSAMQWDLWNPWAKWYELNSTHPLVAKRLLYLADQAAHQGQEPLVVFDRRQPESYWDDFFVDLVVMLLPWLGIVATVMGVLAACFSYLGQPGGAVPPWVWLWIAGGLVLTGLFNTLQTNFSYRRKFFPYLSVAALLHKVKVSAVRPVPATLTGTVIGKGVPGLVWSEDFVLRDRTGIIFLDYRQPLALWDFLFGLMRAGAYQGKEVRVTGWFRRSPVPYLEIFRVETLDGSLPPRRCYTLHARLAANIFLVVAGILVALVPLFL